MIPYQYATPLYFHNLGSLSSSLRWTCSVPCLLLACHYSSNRKFMCRLLVAFICCIVREGEGRGQRGWGERGEGQRQTDRQAERQTDKLTHTERQTERQTQTKRRKCNVIGWSTTTTPHHTTHTHKAAEEAAVGISQIFNLGLKRKQTTTSLEMLIAGDTCSGSNTDNHCLTDILLCLFAKGSKIRRKSRTEKLYIVR